MTNSHYDIIIVGGGHNGLTCAAYLAKAGRNVLVLERNEQVGGAAVTREFADGFRVSSCAQWLYQFNPSIRAELKLDQYGYELAAENLSTIALAADGDHLTLSSSGLGGTNVSEPDKKAYELFMKQMLKFSGLLAKASERRVPKLLEANWRDRFTLFKLGLGMKLLGKEDMQGLLRIALINIYDVLQENFDNDLVKAALSLDATLGTHMGPRSPNTVFSFLHRRLGEVFGFNGVSVVKGGMSTLSQALASAATANGVEIRTAVPVSRINSTADEVTGVTLASGEIIEAPTVVSNADPKTTFKNLLGFPKLETGVVRRVSNIRMQGNVAKLHLALDSLPQFDGLNENQSGQRLLIVSTMDAMERAFNSAKYGEYSQQPVMDISIPTLHDKTLAPEGKHVLSALVQYAPYKLKQNWDSVKENYTQLLVERLAEFAPGIENQILNCELLTPIDLEREFHLAGGHWHHGEISLDQIMMTRPFPGATQYAMPLTGLYLCGAGAHPGGGVMGLAGKNSAQEILRNNRNKPNHAGEKESVA